MKGLERYWQIIKRRRMLVLIPCLIAFLLGVITFRFPQPQYLIRIRFITAQTPLPITQEDEEARLFNWRTSEYIVHGIKDWVNGSVFLGMVKEQLLQKGYEPNEVDLEQVRMQITAEALASQVIIYIQGTDEEMIEALAEVIVPLIEQNHSAFIPQLGNKSADLRRVDGDLLEKIDPPSGAYLGVVRQMLAGLMAGFLLVLLAEYFDPFVNTADDLSLLGLPAIGVIPALKPSVTLRELPAFLMSKFQQKSTRVFKGRV